MHLNSYYYYGTSATMIKQIVCRTDESAIRSLAPLSYVPRERDRDRKWATDSRTAMYEAHLVWAAQAVKWIWNDACYVWIARDVMHVCACSRKSNHFIHFEYDEWRFIPLQLINAIGRDRDTFCTNIYYLNTFSFIVAYTFIQYSSFVCIVYWIIDIQIIFSFFLFFLLVYGQKYQSECLHEFTIYRLFIEFILCMCVTI